MKKADEGAAEYVARALALDLTEESAQVIALRQAFLAPDAQPSPPEAATTRADARLALESLRRSFWAFGDAGFEERARALPCEAFPELGRQLARLRDVARTRAEFVRADADLEVDAAFLQRLRAIVIAPPRLAGALKAELVESLRDKGRRKTTQASVRTLAAEFPEIHRLEEHWLGEVLEVQQTFRASSRSSGAILLAFSGLLFMRALYEILKTLT